MTGGMDMKDFTVDIDRENRIITIQGIRYSFDMFNAIGFAVRGSTFRIGERGDGVVTLELVVVEEGSPINAGNSRLDC